MATVIATILMGLCRPVSQEPLPLPFVRRKMVIPSRFLHCRYSILSSSFILMGRAKIAVVGCIRGGEKYQVRPETKR